MHIKNVVRNVFCLGYSYIVVIDTCLNFKAVFVFISLNRIKTNNCHLSRLTERVAVRQVDLQTTNYKS